MLDTVQMKYAETDRKETLRWKAMERASTFYSSYVFSQLTFLGVMKHYI